MAISTQRGQAEKNTEMIEMMSKQEEQMKRKEYLRYSPASPIKTNLPKQAHIAKKFDYCNKVHTSKDKLNTIKPQYSKHSLDVVTWDFSCRTYSL